MKNSFFDPPKKAILVGKVCFDRIFSVIWLENSKRVRLNIQKAWLCLMSNVEGLLPPH